MKKVLIVLIHCIFNLSIQLGFGARMFFFYDYSISDIISWTAIGVGLVIIDYLICILILKTKNQPMPWIIHCADLIPMIPYLAFRGYCIYLDLIGPKSTTTFYSRYDIVWMIGILLADLCLVVERILLIKKY